MDTTYARLREALATPRSVWLDFTALNVFFRLGVFRAGFREIRPVSPEPIFLQPAISRNDVIDADIDLFRGDIRFFVKNVNNSAGIRLLAAARAPDLPQILMTTRTFRALVIPRHGSDIEWSSPLSVCSTEFQKLASAESVGSGCATQKR